MITVHSSEKDERLRGAVIDSLAAEFSSPVRLPTGGAVEQFDSLMGALLSSSKVRLVSPTGANMLAIQQVVADAVQRRRPLRILMPWGSKKPDNGILDVAEVGGLKTVAALIERVSAVHEPGVEVRIRVEDLSGDYLFREEGQLALLGSAVYVEELRKLFNVMEVPSTRLLFERALIGEEDYNDLADEMRPLFFRYMMETDGLGTIDDPSISSFRPLERAGWCGLIPSEQREFYISRYAKAWPGRAPDFYLQKLAGYFASILARSRMGGYGSEDWDKDFINLSFAPPVPGTPPSHEKRRVFYRTVPESQTRTHIPPWRALGYLKAEGASVVTKLAAAGEKVQLVEGYAQIIGSDGDTAIVRAPMLYQE